MSYKVRLQFFEGPLDLLLFLIRKEKIDIYNIPISMITEQYLSYLELLKLLDLNIAGEFLVMAATLMHIKSKMLLPPDENEEEEDQEDPRDELVRRLLEYKRYKEAATQLQAMKDKSREVFFRSGNGEKESVIIDGEEYFEASLFDLIGAFRKILKSVPKEKFHEIIKSKFTVSDKIHVIYHLLADKPKIYFSELFMAAESKDEIIAIFLAVLELIKLKEIIVAQKSYFEEIEIVRNPELVEAGREAGGPVDNET